MINPSEFLDLLHENGFSFATGVPCSYFSRLINEFENIETISYIPATREDEAVGIASGVAFGGARAFVIMQNSGYATTGHQATTSGTLNYPALLDGFGIPNIVPILRNDSIEDVKDKIQIWLHSSEISVLPALVDAKPPTLSNIPLHPEQITELQKTSTD
ncbi:MAG: hypothetical protein RTV31_00795 [Candidatus Thorarchaeota archaeon]